MALNCQLRSLIANLEAEEAAQRSKGNVHSYHNHGDGFQNVTGSKVNSGLFSGDGNTHHTYNNHGHGPGPAGNFLRHGSRAGAAINYPGSTFLEHDSDVINNSGSFLGHGNGSFVGGNFDASSLNYRRY